MHPRLEFCVQAWSKQKNLPDVPPPHPGQITSSRSMSFLRLGHQACMQYYNLSLTNDLYYCKIISSDLQVKVLLIIRSILLAAFVAFKHNLLSYWNLLTCLGSTCDYCMLTVRKFSQFYNSQCSLYLIFECV